MKFFLLMLALSLAFVSSIEIYSDICYDGLGCFTTRPPFSTNLARPVALLPQAPTIIDTRFYLYTRENQFYPSALAHDYDSQYFKNDVPIKLIIHGFIHNGFKKYILDIKDALLKAEDVNVIVVDWSAGNRFPYSQATANTQVVGAEVARLVKGLISRQAINPEDVHIIGHSLGSHIAGYAGERIPNLGRITGLDPAGPYFENTDPKVRLDPTDAKFVDVIHTDGAASLNLGLGLMQPLGHVDYYPNGGKYQPSCPSTSVKLLSAIFNFATFNIDNLEDSALCQHMSAVYYFTDSIQNKECGYTAYPCFNKEDFDSGKCLSCSIRGCNHLGYKASPTKDLGMLFFNTQHGEKFPFCQHQMVVALSSNTLSGQNQARGQFSVVFTGSKTKSQPILLDDSETTFKTGSTEVRLVASTKYIGEDITDITVSYTKTTNFLSSFLYQDKWSFSNIQIIYGDNQKTFKYCPSTPYILSGSSVNFKKC